MGTTQVISRDYDIFKKYVGALKETNQPGQAIGLCPFHEDTIPSLSVNSLTGEWYCHSCKEGGNLLGFYMKLKTGIDQETAVKEIEELYKENSIKALEGDHKEILETPKASCAIMQQIAAYIYTDLQGNPLRRVIRYEPKTFRQQHFKNDKWVWGRGNTEDVLYNQPEIVQAETVFIVEGEKDCESLKKFELVATTCINGAGKWKDSYNAQFKGKKVIILPDNDEPGKEHALMVAQSVKGIAESVKIVELPNLPDKGDVSDWIAQGGTKDSLLFIAEVTDEWKPNSTTFSVPLTNAEICKTETEVTLPQIKSLEDSLPSDYELISQNIQIEWLVEKLIAKKAITVIHAKGGTGKTGFIVGLAKAVTQGNYFLGLKTQQNKVTYCDFDNPLDVLISRIKQVGASGVKVWHRSNLEIKLPKIDSEGWEQFKSLPQDSLLIFDTLRASQSLDENDGRHMAIVMERFRSLCDVGYTVVLLHHNPKYNDRVYKGSSSISDLADCVISLEKRKKNKPDEILDDSDKAGEFCFWMGTDKTRYAPFQIFLKYDQENGFSLATGGPNEDCLLAIQEIIKKFNAENNKWLNQRELVEKVVQETVIKKAKAYHLLSEGKEKYWSFEKGESNSKIYRVKE